MNKIGLIIAREYLTRVRDKKFLITTLITPLVLLLFFLTVGWIFSYESARNYHIEVINQSGVGVKLPENKANLNFHLSDKTLDQLKSEYQNGKSDGILVLPRFSGVDVRDYTTYYYSDDPLDIVVEKDVQKVLEKSFRDEKSRILQIDPENLKKLDLNLTLDPEPIALDQRDRTASTGKIAMVLGGVMGYIIFIVIILYGAMLMRSVSEEKTNRIVELVISSVKPTQLMLGKITGVGLVGITQLLIWMVLIPIIMTIGTQLTGLNPDEVQTMSGDLAGAKSQINEFEIQSVFHEIFQLNWFKIFFLFILYFIGGYYIYASQFAALGAAMGDDTSDSQSYTLIVTMPIVLSIYIMFQAIRLPESNLAFFASIFPLFSPIVMPALLAFDPPWWQIILSVAILCAFAIFMIWLSGKIYRTGILMYGKKASFKELAKWIWAKN